MSMNAVLTLNFSPSSNRPHLRAARKQCEAHMLSTILILCQIVTRVGPGVLLTCVSQHTPLRLLLLDISKVVEV